MKFKWQLILGLGVLGGLIGVYFADETMTAKKEQKKQENAVALYFENKDCVKFAMKNAQGTFVFERADFQSPWRMIFPKQLMADQDSVNSLLVSLRNIGVQRTLDQDENLDTYGLAKHDLYFEITLMSSRGLTAGSNGNKTTKMLTFGKNINENGTGFQLPSVYAKVTGKPILVVDNSSVPSFNEKTFADFRTKNVVHFKTADVGRISIRPQQNNSSNVQNSRVKDQNNNSQNEIIELAQTINEWEAISPTSTSANDSFVVKYLGSLQELTADNIIESPNENTLKSYGLNLSNPTATITFKDANGKMLQELSLYMTKSNIFINMPDGSLAQFELEKWPDLVPKFKYFRDRSIIGMNSKCDSDLESVMADDVLDNVTNVDLQQFGFQKPIKTFTCSMNQNKNNNTKKLEVLVGNRVPLNEKSVYVKRSDSNTVYIVNSELLSMLAEVKSL